MGRFLEVLVLFDFSSLPACSPAFLDLDLGSIVFIHVIAVVASSSFLVLGRAWPVLYSIDDVAEEVELLVFAHGVLEMNTSNALGAAGASLVGRFEGQGYHEKLEGFGCG